MSEDAGLGYLQPSRRCVLRITRTVIALGLTTTIASDMAAADPGEEQWVFQTGTNTRSSPTVVNGTVFFASYDRLYAVDAKTGSEQWALKIDEVQRAPAVVNGTVFVTTYSTSDSSLYAVNAEEGTVQWSFKTNDRVNTSPTVVDETVFFGCHDNNLYAIDAETGEKKWSFETGESINSSPTVANGTVYIGSGDGNLYAVDFETGTEQWSFKTNEPIESSPTISEGTVFVGSNDGNLYAVNNETGEQEWEFQTTESGDPHVEFRSSPTVANGTVFTGSDKIISGIQGIREQMGVFYAIDAKAGSKKWEFRTGGEVRSGNEIYSSPTVANGIVFVGCRDNHLYAIDAETGEQEWEYEISEGTDTSPIVVDGSVFITSHDGNLYSIDTRVAGSSEGSRVLLGTLGHHGDWRYAGQSIGVRTTKSKSSWVRDNAKLLAGGAGTLLGSGYLLRRRQKSTEVSQDDPSKHNSEDPDSDTSEGHEQSTTATNEPTTGSESVTDGHQTAAEEALETAVTAESNEKYGKAVDAYSDALSEYQAALRILPTGATEQRKEIEQIIESTRADLEAVKTRREQQNEVIDDLQPAERSLQEAIVAYIENDRTVARIRFRQARDTFEDAQETIVENEADLLTEPVAVDVQPDREPSSTTLSDLPGIPKAASAELAKLGIEAVDDLDSSDKSPWTPAVVEELVDDDTIEEDAATTLTLLSWWQGDKSYEFDTAQAVERRQQQADYGFNQTS